MRIGINALLLSRCESGVENTIAGFLRTLADAPTVADRQYTVYLPNPTAYPVSAGQPNWHRVEVRIPLCRRLSRILWEQFILPRQLRRDNVDVLFAPAYLAPLRTQVPVVLAVHDLIALTNPQWCTFANALNYRLLLPPSIRRAARIIVPSHATLRELTERFPTSGAKCQVIPFGIDPGFTPIRDADRLAEVRRRYGLPRDYLLFLGRHEPKKNLTRLVMAYTEIRTRHSVPHALVLGGVRAWDSRELDRVITQSPVRDNIIRPGFIRPEDLPALYSGAALFVFPSLYEGFGIPPLEAMACGTPVVTSNRGALPETAGDAALCIDPLDIQALAVAMIRVLTDHALRTMLQEKGWQHCRAYKWSRTVDRILQICEETRRTPAAPGMTH